MSDDKKAIIKKTKLECPICGTEGEATEYQGVPHQWAVCPRCIKNKKLH